jgi:proline iminopeptidase
MGSLILFLSLLLVQPAQEAREGYIAADDGTRLHYRIEGDGPETLVVVHGGPGNSLESVRLDLVPLARRRRVIYYDQRGNGGSELVGDAARLAVTLHIADLEAIRRHFGLERMTLLGNSWGGVLVSAYAAAHPDRVQRLVLHAPAPPSLAHLRAMNERLNARMQERMSAAERARFAEIRAAEFWLSSPDPFATCHEFFEAIFRMYRFDPVTAPPFHGDVCAGTREAVRRQQWVNAAVWRSLGDFDLADDVERVRAPVLVIHGVADVVPLAGSRDWATHYPDARLLVFRRSGHLLHLEEPDAFFAAVETFLAGRWPAGAERVSPGE